MLLMEERYGAVMQRGLLQYLRSAPPQVGAFPPKYKTLVLEHMIYAEGMIKENPVHQFD